MTNETLLQSDTLLSSPRWHLFGKRYTMDTGFH